MAIMTNQTADVESGEFFPSAESNMLIFTFLVQLASIHFGQYYFLDIILGLIRLLREILFLILGYFILFSLLNNRLRTEESQEWDLSGPVQGVGLMGWVNTRPLVCLNPPRFFNLSTNKVTIKKALLLHYK